jgi:hypothetical protein
MYIDRDSTTQSEHKVQSTGDDTDVQDYIHGRDQAFPDAAATMDAQGKPSFAVCIPFTASSHVRCNFDSSLPHSDTHHTRPRYRTSRSDIIYATPDDTLDIVGTLH